MAEEKERKRRGLDGCCMAYRFEAAARGLQDEWAFCPGCGAPLYEAG